VQQKEGANVARAATPCVCCATERSCTAATWAAPRRRPSWSCAASRWQWRCGGDCLYELRARACHAAALRALGVQSSARLLPLPFSAKFSVTLQIAEQWQSTSSMRPESIPQGSKVSLEPLSQWQLRRLTVTATLAASKRDFTPWEVALSDVDAEADALGVARQWQMLALKGLVGPVTCARRVCADAAQPGECCCAVLLCAGRTLGQRRSDGDADGVVRHNVRRSQPRVHKRRGAAEESARRAVADNICYASMSLSIHNGK
jgi:hypothetical protein